MRNTRGFTLIEFMIVVAIIEVLAGIAIPMYNSNVYKAKLQEATDTLGAMEDAVCKFVADNGAPLPAFPDHQILPNLGIQVPQSLGSEGGRKWWYRTEDTSC